MQATSTNTPHLPTSAKLLLAPLLLLSACTTAPAPHASQTQPAAPLAVYPSAGQSPERISRDRYECHLWAVQQSHFDPATMAGDNAALPVPASPGNNTATGAVVGGVAGAILSGPHHGGEGALVGAVMGAVVGAAGDAPRPPLPSAPYPAPLPPLSPFLPPAALASLALSTIFLS